MLKRFMKAIEQYKQTDEYKAAVAKTQLEAEDYKIIKCAEAFMQSKPLPYDIAKLSAERDVLREEVSAIEAKLEPIEIKPIEDIKGIK